ACNNGSSADPTTANAPAIDAGSGQPPTVEEARSFLADVDTNLRRLWVARDRAAWVNENFITDDTEALAAAGEEATAAYVTETIKKARRFDPLLSAKPSTLPSDLARQLTLLKLAQTVPAPDDLAARKELAKIEVGMQGAYGKAKYCPPSQNGGAPNTGTNALPDGGVNAKCETLDDLSKTLATSRNYDQLLEAWTGWHAMGKSVKADYSRYVELGNQGAKAIGYDDLGALWRAGYDMPPADFEADIERLWQQVKPLYEELHCYVRAQLQVKYGKEKVPDHAPIPAHLLGNMWAQEWNNIFDVVQPYKDAPSLDVSKTLATKKIAPQEMVKMGESFFTSLGFDNLPKTFWERSLFTRPRDRDVVCHASSWDVTWSDDLRLKVCIQPTEEDLITLHHELGHSFYFQSYFKLPMLFQQGANDGFHEAIGDTIALSVTPGYLEQIGLLQKGATTSLAGTALEHEQVNQQMKMALDKVAFLPFGLLIDKWRWDVFSGKTKRDNYNAAWWELARKYQGIAPPIARTEDDFDPGAKYHVDASVPYIRYFLARIYQFQFHRALCKASGFTGPLDQCSIFGNKAAGDKLKAMLALGASKPWPEALAAMDGETKADASAMLEYFAPLRKFLEESNKSQTCGW
ncbi:MAG: M2 family metallopeptidase, partial [Polyangiaceae bacterium]